MRNPVNDKETRSGPSQARHTGVARGLNILAVWQDIIECLITINFLSNISSHEVIV
jgi:hypothetical protein